METTATYVLRAARGAGPVRLEPGGCVRIGRHASNDVVLDDPTVSRFHARITWPRGACRPQLDDLGSANGTIVDGVVVRRSVPLEERAIIGVGDVVVAGELEHPSLIADDGKLECRLFSEWEASTEEGVLSSARTLRDLLLDLERAGRTGTLALEQAGATTRLTLAAGRIVDARADTLSGKSALHAALERADRGLFVLRPEVEPHDCPLSVSPCELLSRGAAGTERLERADAWPEATPPRRLTSLTPRVA